MDVIKRIPFIPALDVKNKVEFEVRTPVPLGVAEFVKNSVELLFILKVNGIEAKGVPERGLKPSILLLC